MKSLLLFLIVLSGSLVSAQSRDQLEILIPSKPGGLAHVQADTIKSAAELKNINIKIDFSGTCQNAARIFKQNDPVIVILATHIYADSRCNFDSLERFQLLTYLQQQPLMVCHKNDRADLGVAHFQNPASRKSLAVISYFKPVVDNLAADQKQSNIRVIAVGVSNDIKAQTFLNQFDYFLLDTDYATKNTDRLTCIANTSNQTVFGVPALKTVWSRPSVSNEFYISHMLVTNRRVSDNVKKLFDDIINGSVWSEYISKQNGVTTLPKNIDHFEYLKQQAKLFAQ
jgi:hypothetical protein